MLQLVLDVEPIANPEGTMADEGGDPDEGVRRHVRRILEQLTARERKKSFDALSLPRR